MHTVDWSLSGGAQGPPLCPSELNMGPVGGLMHLAFLAVMKVDIGSRHTLGTFLTICHGAS